MGKVASNLSRRLRVGGGTTFPGTLARRIDPQVLRRVTSALPQGVALLTGTNGKTTTARMIASMLRADHRRVLHNRAGANLISGLTATAITDTDALGRPHATIGLFETDEAALPQAIVETQPRLVIIHNLFRDQLDRYGEVDTLSRAWRAALETLPPTTHILLNADDPGVADLGIDLAAQVWYYGLEDARHATGAAAHIADSHYCRRSGARYEYTLAFYAHIGHYRCPVSGYMRPQPHVRLIRLDMHGTTGSRLFITYPGGAMEIDFPLPGLYNALNALAATTAGLALDIPPWRIRAALEEFTAAFGRIERIQAGHGGPPMLIALIKNPVGASETVRMLIDSQNTASNGPTAVTDTQSPASGLQLLIAINDRFADGTDVSWLWDADFELLAGQVAHVLVSGTRAADMAVRLKYAGIASNQIVVEPDLTRAVDTALTRLPSDGLLYILPTYTAMLELRADLARRGWVRPFWEE
jgi:UDP-N-acetylmuramyl tripeptide synthase